MNVILITADSHLILFLVKLAFYLKYIPGNIPVTAFMASNLQISSLLQWVFVVEPVSEDLYDLLVRYIHHVESNSCILILLFHWF
jgi:hypothetical protein